MTASLGVDAADTDASPLLTNLTRREPSVFASFLTLELGIVPNGAMFSSTPWRAISRCGYSIKLGAGGRNGGSTHLSIKVFGLFASPCSATAASVWLAVRVCRGFVVIVALPLRAALPKFTTSVRWLAQGHDIRIDSILLLYSRTAQHLEQSLGRPGRTR